MADFITPDGSRPRESAHPITSPDTSGRKGVRGWLLVFCLMLTVIGPLISSWLMAYKYVSLEPSFAVSRSLEVATFISIVIEACSVAFGVYAGIRLWSIRPGAVDTAKQALLIGLAANVVTTALLIATGPTSNAEGRLLHEVTMKLIPDFIFFAVCFAYLNKSSRVHVTYQM